MNNHRYENSTVIDLVMYTLCQDYVLGHMVREDSSLLKFYH